MSVVPTFGELRQEDNREFEARMGCLVSSRQAMATEGGSVQESDATFPGQEILSE